MKITPLLFAAFFSLANTGWSGLVISFDPADLLVTATGMDQVVDVGILIEWDGVGANTLSGFTLNYSSGDPALVAIQGSGAPSDFTWGFGPVITPTSITAANFGGNQTIDMTGTQLLATMHFTLDAAFTSGMIPINLTFGSAERGFMAIPPSEVTVTGGTLNVTAVPEPASLAMMGLAACGAFVLCHRRRKLQIEQVP